MHTEYIISGHCNYTHTAKVLVQKFHITVNYFQSDQLVVLVFDGTAEVKAGIPTYKIKNIQ